MKKIFSRILPIVTAQAHCDIPCGIYEPTPAKIAAKTVLRMTEQLNAFELPKNWDDSHERLHYLNGVNRRVAVKEAHAEICKRELSILWSDFFKPEHLEKNPDLHAMFWNAEKLCSKTKQDVDEEAAKKLVDAVDAIAKAFYEAKKVPERYDAYKLLTDKLY
jgi:nickel superoxide dismutase